MPIAKTFSCCQNLGMVSCVVINYNGLKFLKSCLDSLLALTYKDKEIIVIDNASSDDSVGYIKQTFPHVRVIANPKNTGYAGAANQAVEISHGEYLMILNPDIVFEPNYLDVLVKRLGEDSNIGAIIGKLRRFDWEKREKTIFIDSAGLLMYKNRRCVDRGQGSLDEGQFDVAEEVFGITGACPLYRRAALEDVKIDTTCPTSGARMGGPEAHKSPPWRGKEGATSLHNYKRDPDKATRAPIKQYNFPLASDASERGRLQSGFARWRGRRPSKTINGTPQVRGEPLNKPRAPIIEYFDSDFFMYKEDVDISWRMRLFGWSCFYEPAAVAYHVRGTGAVKRDGLFSVAARRHELSRFQKHHSYRNERLMRVKNELWPMPLNHAAAIIAKEFLMLGWMIFREPYLFKSLVEFLLKFSSAKRKREQIIGKIKVDSGAMQKWFV